MNQIKALIVAIYLNYYIRLTNKGVKDENPRSILQNQIIKQSLLKLSNYYSKIKKNDEIKDNIDNNKIYKLQNEINQKDKQKAFINQLGIEWEPLGNEYMKFKSDNIKNFSIFFENECEFIIDNIDLDKGIAKNRIIKENIFLQFIAITSNIPLIIIGKPGSSKTLSFQQIKKSMRGKYSKSNFFRKYPQILTTYFQGSESTLADDIENLFIIGKQKLIKYEEKKENKPISLLIFDEIGLSEFAKDNPVKVLHKNLEYDGVKDGLSFVGFSNWKLDPSKLNRVLYLCVPDLESSVDDLKDTSNCIAESIGGKNNYDPELLSILSKCYQLYQERVKKIKEYVVYKELELQEMRQVLDLLKEDEIKKYFKKDKKDITLDDFINIRKNIKTYKKYSWEYGDFENMKKMNEYQVLYAKNRSVNQEFHGNRDFYNYNKGVCNIKSLSKNNENNNLNISEQIEMVIERNFAGVEINLDLDLKLNYNDERENMDSFNEMLKSLKNKDKLKLPSVFLFKYIYNKTLKNLYKINDGNELDIDENDKLKLNKYQINENNLNNYNLVECINGNINDNDARFLLLEIDEGLKYLVYQHIKSQNKDKTITYMEGSPFINDIKDKNGEYKIKKISEIQNYCNKEMVLILSNLNQIYPFLYDFFNRNFIIKEDKKYGRICQGNFTAQLTYIHDKFRIIIMIDKKYIYKQEAPFLNRFEKAIVKFEELLDNKQKAGSRNIYQDLRIKEQIEKMNINYNIENLLIYYDQTSIDRLYFYYSNKLSKVKQEKEKEDIKSIIFEKIARTLPQDIIINLEDNHPIKSIYNKKNIFNLKDYINYLNDLSRGRKDKKNIFKFSIIYTFTSIISNFDEANELIISTVKRENDLIELINEKKFKNKRFDKNFFVMHLYQNELDKINFIMTTLKNNYADEEIKFIFIVHIKRIMDKKKKEKIYSVPDIDEEVDQIFIDNLDGLNISLESLAKEGITKILRNEKLIDKKNEFVKALKKYYNSYTDKLNYINDYIVNVIKYFNKFKDFIDIILSKAFDLICNESKNNIKDEIGENMEIFNKIKKEIFVNSYITPNSIDIVSLIINDVIIEKRLRNAIMKVIDVLESDNFISTLFNLENNTQYESFTSKENLCDMMKQYLNFAKITDIQKKSTFMSNYMLPGFFPFYNMISEYISKNIAQEFFNNEKKYRDALKGLIKLESNFHSKEAELLHEVKKEIFDSESDNYKFIKKVINKCPCDLLLKDYINFFLNKNIEQNTILEDFSDIKSNSSENDEEKKKNEKNDFYFKIIEQMISIRYKDDTNIIKDNKDIEFNIFLIKIIWIEANKNYISTIIDLFETAKNQIYGEKNRNMLIEQVNNLIINNKIKYITDDSRNPENTIEVNECYAIILGALYLSITDLTKIILYDPDNNKDYIEEEENQIKVKINDYLECLHDISKVSQPFNDKLHLFSNELYIIVELNSIINLFKLQKNEYIDIQIVEKIINNLRENIDIVRENKFNKTIELKKNVKELNKLLSNNLLNKDKKYYSLLRNIFLQEMKKIKDKNYRLNLFKTYILNEKEILLYANEIFDLLLKGCVVPSKDKMLNSIIKLEDIPNQFLLDIEDKIKENKNEYFSQIILYYFEKVSYIYLENYFKSKTEKKNEKNLLEKEPLDVFKKCMELLSGYFSSKSEIKNVSKLVYIGYIRVFIYKFEEYRREKSEKLNNPEIIIKSINLFKNRISFMVEFFYYKVIYNKNNKEIDVFSSENDLYKFKLLNNFKDLHSEINEGNYSDENNDKENLFTSILNEKFDKIKNLKKDYPFNEYFYYSDYIDEKYLSLNIINEDKNNYPILVKYLELKKNNNILDDFYIYNLALNSLNEEYSTKYTREKAKKEKLEDQPIYKNNKDLFDKFFEIYNKLSNYNDNYDDDDNDKENKNKINMNLNPAMPLFNFFIDDDNKFSENYKYIYEKFIDKHNEIVEELLKVKLISIDELSLKKDKANVQNITKEDEIFTIKKDFSIQNLLFYNSYRKVIINSDYSEFNKFEINLEYIEEMLTDILLKNKKLISDEIFKFKYKNEDLEFENENICTKFKEKINEEELSINDKILIYQFYEENEGNADFHLRILDDFSYLVIYCSENIDKIGEPPKTTILQLLKGLDYISNDFISIFKENKENNNFTISKLLNLYEYYQILCFNKVKEKLAQYQKKIGDEKQNQDIENYIINDLKKNEIIKSRIEIAIRKLILCFLAKENDKERKIKLNKNNIKNYLEIQDLWSKDFYKQNEYYQELTKLKNLGITVNSVIPFYDKCFKNTYKNYFDDVKTELKNREEERLRLEKEKEKEDINNFNPNDVDIVNDEEKNQEEIEDNKNEENQNEENNNNNEKNVSDDDNGSDYIDQGDDDEDNDDGDRY